MREAEVQEGCPHLAVALDEVGGRAAPRGRRGVGGWAGGGHDAERRGPPLPLPPSPGAAEERSQLVERQAERVPAVAQPERATQRARAPPAEPDRNARLR